MKNIFKVKRLLILLSVFTVALCANAQTINYDSWRNASESAPYNVTFLMVNPTGTENTGWSRNSKDAAAGYNKHNTEFASSVYDNTGIESWYWSPVQSADLIWQDVKGLLPGTYRVKAYAVGQIYNNTSRKGQCGKGSYFFAGDQKVAITSNKWQELSVTATVDESQTLRIGISADDTNENDWVSIAQVRLECVGFDGFSYLNTIVLDERYDVSVARVSGFCNVVLHKTLSSDRYETFCVPFSMTSDDVNKYFSEVLLVNGVSKNGDAFTLKTKKSDVIEAGTPYLVKSKVSGRQSIEVMETAITPLNEVQPVVKSYTGLNFIASYRCHEVVQDAYLLSDDGKTMLKSDVASKVKGYGFYGIKR